MNQILSTLGLLLILVQAHADTELVYIGTRGIAAEAAQNQEAPPGIYAARLDTKTGHITPLGLQVPLDRATWLLAHPDRPLLYAVADSGGGRATESNVYAFTIDASSGKPTLINRVGAGGLDATHLDLDRKSQTLFVANHDSGDVTALPVQPDGRLAPVASSQKQYGTGPHRRQNRPQAHGVGFDPSGRYLLATDFGADRIFVYRFDRATRALSAANPPYEALPAGSGPRHLLFHPQGKFLYLATELTAEFRAYRWDARKGRLHLLQTLSAYPADYSGDQKSAGDIAMSADGRFVYVTLRGDQDSIVACAVDKRTGILKEIQRIGSDGKTPWSLGLDRSGRWLFVANEGSGSVTVFGVDRATGRLTPTGASLAVPKPVAVTFWAN